MELLRVWKSGSLVLVPFLGVPFLLLICLVQLQCHGLFCYVLLLPLRIPPYSNERQEGSGSGREGRWKELEGEEEKPLSGHIVYEKNLFFNRMGEEESPIQPNDCQGYCTPQIGGMAYLLKTALV